MSFKKRIEASKGYESSSANAEIAKYRIVRTEIVRRKKMLVN
jgi:hypothetical protein